MLDGVMLLWFLFTAAAVLFVAIDIRSTPESPVLKWGFLLVTAYTGVVGAFLYVLGCREPLPGLHERYVAARWRQTLGSAMHCVAGDGVGILAGAVISSIAGLTNRIGRSHPRICPWLCLRLDDFPGLVHARHGRRLLQARTDEYIHTRTVVDESADGGNGADSDDTQSEYPIRKRSHDAKLLVCDVDGPSGRFRHRLSD